MKQLHPAVRALCEQMRRPTVKRLMLGLALITPAALMSNNEQESRKAPAPQQQLAPLVVQIGPGEPWSRDARENGAISNVREYAREYRIAEPLAKEIHTAAVANGISPKIAFGLVRAESSFRTRIVSPVGAVGLTQLLPSTARWVEPGTSRRSLMEPRTNLRIGFKYLKSLIEQYDGNEKLALTAFNRGPGTVDKLLRRGRNPDNGYYDKVVTGRSSRHVALMNAKFGKRRSS